MPAKYLNFDLLIKREGKAYTATVSASPAGGDRSTTFDLPFSDLELENLRLKITRGRAAVRGSTQVAGDTTRAFGERLFNAVFSGEVENCFRASLNEAANQGAGLRLRVNGSAELNDVPWEYLYSPELDRFLSLSAETPIVRYVPTSHNVPALALVPPLQLLVMVADPTDFTRLNVEREWTTVRQAVADLEQRGLLVIERLASGSFAALQQKLRRTPYHILHFVGHGLYDKQTKEGMLVFEDSNGRGRPVSGREIGTLLHDYTSSLRLVVLNACEGARAPVGDPFAGVAQALVRQRIPAVVAMQYEISDEAAVTFSREFYGAMADGSSLDSALADSRKAMFADGWGLEWGTPALYTLSSDGQVFDVQGPAGGARALPRPAAIAPPVHATATAPHVEPPPIARPVSVAGAPTVAPRISPPLPAQMVTVASRLVSAVGPSLLLAAIFLINLLETWADARLTPTVSDRALTAATTMRWLEQQITFENHDMASGIAVYGYSLAYFFLFPFLALAVMMALARRRDPEPYRVFALAIAVDYFISFWFFVFFPVPERWAFPQSGAILLSDLWSSNLIEAFRPMSALDNCFPSFHVSMTVIMVRVCYLYDIRLRTAIAALGAMVVLSTFTLGVHWVPDMVSGAAVAVISVCVAKRLHTWEISRRHLV